MKNKVKVLVIGAGAAGLGAAAWLREKQLDFMVVEGASELPLNLHNGVHYLHSIPELPFDTDLKAITLTDGILVDGEISHTPNLLCSLQYSEKVREIQHPSSIMDVGKESKVYMPKSNSVNATLKQCYEFAGADNFQFGYWLKEIDASKRIATFQKDSETVSVEYEHLISAIPLDKFREMVSSEFLVGLKLEATPVHITNYKVDRIVPNWMINLYIPDPNSPVYRASLLNGVCSVESMRELNEHEIYFTRNVLGMFHISLEEPEKFTWKTGKVTSISIDDRIKLVEELHKLEIYQIGRFGLWNRKLLVDSTIGQAKAVVDYIDGLRNLESIYDWSTTSDKLSK
jgi:hypothetical protein